MVRVPTVLAFLGGLVLSASACALLTNVGDLHEGADDPDGSGGGALDSGVPLPGTGDSSTCTTPNVDGSNPNLDSAATIDGPIDPGIRSCAATDLVAYWKMDEGAGTSIKDCTSNHHDGTTTGGATWTAGRSGAQMAANFGTNMNELIIPTHAALQRRDAFTMTMWLWVNDEYGGVAGRSTDQNQVSWAFWYSSGPILHFGMKDATKAPTPIDISATHAFPKNQWHHIAGVFRAGSAVELWIDSKLETSTPTTLLLTPDFGTMKIAHTDDPGDAFGHLNGRLQQVRLFARALSSGEIVQLATEP